MSRNEYDTRWIRSAVADHEHRLIAYAQRLLRDPDRARDAVQEVFCRLCRQTRADVEGHLLPWLYTVCRNQVLDMQRKERRMRPAAITLNGHAASTESPPDQSLEADETRSRAMNAVAALPERQREIVRLKFEHDMSYREISAITGDSVSNVGYLLHHALKALRQQMTRSSHTPAARAQTAERRSS